MKSVEQMTIAELRDRVARLRRAKRPSTRNRERLAEALLEIERRAGRWESY